MSGEGDQVIFQTTVEDRREEYSNVLFKDKNYNMIVDQTSNSGSFASNMISFDLSTLASQGQWTSLSEAVIEFPVKISATATVASTFSTASFTIKNGFHSFIDTCQLVINGVTVQSSQSFENVNTTFKILSNWSADELQKYGKTFGIILDDCTNDNASNTVTGLANCPAGSAANSVFGFNAYATAVGNKALNARSSLLADVITSNTFEQNILGATNMKLGGAHVCAFNNATGSTPCYQAVYLARVRLKDICSVEEFPLVKNIKGFLYLGFNSTQAAMTANAGGSVTSVSISPLGGRSCPFMANTTAITFGASSVVTVTGTVDATTGAAAVQTAASPLMSNARLLVPFYEANPTQDAMLMKTDHFFTSVEKIVIPITVGAGQPTNVTLTSGVQNPVALIILPMWQGLGGSSFTSPETSPFDPSPQTSGPFAALQNFQVMCGNKPVFNSPITYDFEAWWEEVSKTGLADGVVDNQASGLLSEALWSTLHRYYYVDLSRRSPAEDGSSRSVQVSFNNPSSTYAMKCICIIQYQKRWSINTTTCALRSTA